MLGLRNSRGEINLKKSLTQEQKPPVRDHQTTPATLFTVKLWKYVAFALLRLLASTLSGCRVEASRVDRG